MSGVTPNADKRCANCVTLSYLSNPKAPLVLLTFGGRDVHYPMELLDLADNQRMGVADVDPTITSNMIKVRFGEAP